MMSRPLLHYSTSSESLLDNKILEMSWLMNLMARVSGFGGRMKSSLVIPGGWSPTILSL